MPPRPRENRPDQNRLVNIARMLHARTRRDGAPTSMEEMLLYAATLGANGPFFRMRLFLTAIAHTGHWLKIKFTVDGAPLERLFRGDPSTGRIHFSHEDISAADHGVTVKCSANTWNALEPNFTKVDISHVLRTISIRGDCGHDYETVFCRMGPNPPRYLYDLPPLSLIGESIPLLHLDETKMDLCTEYEYYRRLHHRTKP